LRVGFLVKVAKGENELFRHVEMGWKIIKEINFKNAKAKQYGA